MPQRSKLDIFQEALFFTLAPNTNLLLKAILVEVRQYLCQIFSFSYEKLTAFEASVHFKKKSTLKRKLSISLRKHIFISASVQTSWIWYFLYILGFQKIHALLKLIFRNKFDIFQETMFGTLASRTIFFLVLKVFWFMRNSICVKFLISFIKNWLFLKRPCIFKDVNTKRKIFS